MADFTFKVSGDPTLLNASPFGVGMQVDGGNGTAHVGFGMPGMTVAANSNGGAVAVGMPGMSMTVSETHNGVTTTHTTSPHMHVHSGGHHHGHGESVSVGVGMPGMSMTVSETHNGVTTTSSSHVGMQGGMGMQISDGNANVHMAVPGVSMTVHDHSGGVGMQVGGGDANVSMQMNMGLPGMSVTVNDNSTHVSAPSTGGVGFQMNLGMPNVSVSIPTPTVVVASSPAPPPAFGQDVALTVSNPHRTGTPGEDERTVYDFSIRTNLREFYPYNFHTKSVRYNDVFILHDQLCKSYGAQKFPPFPKKNFFGRFDELIINERLVAFQRLMDVIIRDPTLRQSHLFLAFLFGTNPPTPHLAPQY